MKENEASLIKRFLSSDEGVIFIVGNCMLILWLTVIIVLFRIEYHHWLDILTMGFTQLFGGRAASIAQGTQTCMYPLLIFLLASYVDTMVLFILYPILVFSYRNFFEKRFFQKRMKPLFDSVQKRVTRYRRHKMVTVFFFVWFPFWMTGVIIGSLLGYLLGLRAWVNMTTCILGTMSASFCWVFFYDKLYKWLGNIHKEIPLILTFIIVIGLVIYSFYSKRRNLTR